MDKSQPKTSTEDKSLPSEKNNEETKTSEIEQPTPMEKDIFMVEQTTPKSKQMIEQLTPINKPIIEQATPEIEVEPPTTFPHAEEDDSTKTNQRPMRIRKPPERFSETSCHKTTTENYYDKNNNFQQEKGQIMEDYDKDFPPLRKKMHRQNRQQTEQASLCSNRETGSRPHIGSAAQKLNILNNSAAQKINICALVAARKISNMEKSGDLTKNKIINRAFEQQCNINDVSYQPNVSNRVAHKEVVLGRGVGRTFASCSC